MEGFAVIDFVDGLITEAVNKGASDIHFESHPKVFKIRFRIDGLLYDKSDLDIAIAEQIMSRIKIISHIDISKKRIPQDGKFSILFEGRNVDFRVSTFPGVFGEKVVIRILDKENKIIELEGLGFDNKTLTRLKEIITKPHGLILVTGPTGSGKSTTLYGIISLLNHASKNIITLEDPVEYFIEGITQAQINNESGFTFAKGIRSMLRQDPDIIMIGEIRDRESAQIAIEASLTGHLVLSTLHTNDAPSAIMRLLDMNIEHYLINSSLLAVLAQRLVRQICNKCRTVEDAANAVPLVPSELLSELRDKKLYKGNGCAECNYLGNTKRVGIFELLEVDESIRSFIHPNISFDALKNKAVENGMKTLLEDGLKKLKSGQISLAELLKVIS